MTHTNHRRHDADSYGSAENAVSGFTSLIGNYISGKRQEIQTANQAEIETSRARQAFILDGLKSLRREAAQERNRKRENRSHHSPTWNLIVFVSLTLAAYALAWMTLDPFNLSILIKNLYCAGLALAVSVAVERFLHSFQTEIVVRALVAILFICSLATLVLFAEIRADVFAQRQKTDPVVLIETADISAPLQPTNEADQVNNLLRLAMAFASLSFELASGLALYEFRQGRVSLRRLVQVEEEKLSKEQEYLAELRHMHGLLVEPSKTEAAFWSDLLSELSRRARSRKLGILVVSLLVATQVVRAADSLKVVILVDLSQTEKATHGNGKSEFDENIRAVSGVLARMPAGSSAMVAGITDRSYVNPFILLDAHISEDIGVFGSRLTAGRRTLVGEWNKRATRLTPSFTHSDILGAIILSGEILSHSGATYKRMVLLSDMRNDTDGVNLEGAQSIDVRSSLRRIEQRKLFGTLSGVEVFVMGSGAHGLSKGIAYTQGLRDFWLTYLRHSGAEVRLFSTTRDMQGLADAVSIGASPKR